MTSSKQTQVTILSSYGYLPTKDVIFVARFPSNRRFFNEIISYQELSWVETRLRLHRKYPYRVSSRHWNARKIVEVTIDNDLMLHLGVSYLRLGHRTQGELCGKLTTVTTDIMQVITKPTGESAPRPSEIVGSAKNEKGRTRNKTGGTFSQITRSYFRVLYSLLSRAWHRLITYSFICSFYLLYFSYNFSFLFLKTMKWRPRRRDSGAICFSPTHDFPRNFNGNVLLNVFVKDKSTTIFGLYSYWP